MSCSPDGFKTHKYNKMIKLREKEINSEASHYNHELSEATKLKMHDLKNFDHFDN